MTAPPLDMHADQLASGVFLTGGALFFLVSLVWAVRRSLRGQSWVPVLALAGGVLASLEEPWIDRLIQLWYPADAPLVMFTWFGVAAAVVTMALCVLVVIGLRTMTRSAEQTAGIPVRELEPTT
jgi:hypothetical protein